MYALVSINSGVLDIDYNTLIRAHQVSPTQAIVQLLDDVIARISWQTKTQTDWDNYTSPTLDHAKQDKINQLLQSFNSSFQIFQSSALGVLKTYPVDAEAQSNLDRLERRLIADPNKNDFNFKTMEDGTLVLHTRVQFLQLLQDAETFIVQQTKKYDGYVSQVNVATTNDQVNAIVWS